MKEVIKIYGARTHNLKNVSVTIPKNKLVVITGLSGSGKSTLAFDTIYAEGQRRFVESLSGYARQFLGILPKPDVDKIEGLSPAIAIEQGLGIKNPRSTVGTQTEIYDYLRILFARIGKPHCPRCGAHLSRQTVADVFTALSKFSHSEKIFIYGPAIYQKKGEFKDTLKEIEHAGFMNVKINGTLYPIEKALAIKLDKYKFHTILVLVDKLIASPSIFTEEKARIIDSLELASRIGKNFSVVEVLSRKKTQNYFFSHELACKKCGINFPKIEPRLFSFNSPYGACQECAGIGKKMVFDIDSIIPADNLTILEGAIKPWFSASHRVGRQGYYYALLTELAATLQFSLDVPFRQLNQQCKDVILYGSPEHNFEGVIPNLERRFKEGSEGTREELSKFIVFRTCETCQGKRLKPEALAITIAKKSIWDLGTMYIADTLNFFHDLQKKKFFTTKLELEVGRILFNEITERLQFLLDVGLSYIALNREIETLSGGEAQRVRLATQIGSGLSGVIYVLDEPSAGLHPRDDQMLINALKKLRDLQNTVIVVEHDRAIMENADYIVDLGPGSGKKGGSVLFSGDYKKFLSSKTLTAQYLQRSIDAHTTSNERAPSAHLSIIGATENNLKNVSIDIPLGVFTVVAGVSGSGKSSLINDILGNYLLKYFYRAKTKVGAVKEINGVENIDKVIIVDQSPIGRTPRSNPATYTGVFDFIRKLFTELREAKIRGYTQGKFSFNTKEGRCEHCKGEGFIRVEMHFLAPIYVECEICKGTRYKQEILDVLYNGKSIADILAMDVAEAIEFFSDFSPVARRLKILQEVGLDYITLGQPATTLSGGEAQRIKLAKELTKVGTGKTLYIMDEPTTGLHFDDIKKLIAVINRLVDLGNSVLVIEHNLDVIKSADHIIDLGPEGGNNGGYIIAHGTPTAIAKNPQSHTGKFLQ